MTTDEAPPWEDLTREPALAVVGLGGAGGDAVRDLLELDLSGVRAFAINTDARHLEQVDVPRRILIGQRDLHGRGAGGDREAARRAAEDAEGEIVEQLGGFEIVFLIAGLGGGTGSALLPYVSQRLKKTGALPVPVAFLPFHHELLSSRRLENARESLAELAGLGGLVLALSNEKLRRFAQVPISRALRLRNAYVHGLVAGLVDIVERPSQMNVDLANVKSHLREAGVSALIRAERRGEEPERLIDDAVEGSLLDVELGPRPSALVHIDGGSNLRLETLDRILGRLRERLGPMEELTVGTRIRPEPREVVRVTAVLGGLRAECLSEALGRTAPPDAGLPAV